MIWYWIVLIVLAVLCVFYVCAGYAFFCFVCKPKREASASLDGKGGRSLNAYRPFIQEKALQNSKLPHKMVSISAYDGMILRAKFYPNRLSDRFLILVHGYHSSVAWDFAASFEMYYRAGYSILALENRGHGSEGEYIGYGVLEQHDVRSWMDWIVSEYGNEVRIALSGVSMGAATVLLTSCNYPIPQLKCVIEDCGYSNLTRQIMNMVWERKVPPVWLTASASLWCKLKAGYFFSEASPEKVLPKSQIPTLFLHGMKDNMVPFYMLDRAYAACSAPKEKAVFEDAIHGEASFREPERYEKLVTSFLAKYMN